MEAFPPPLARGHFHHEDTENTWSPTKAGAGKLTMSGYSLVLSLSKDVISVALRDFVRKIGSSFA